MKKSAALSDAAPAIGVGLKSYQGDWKGQILLACGKCQRKLRKTKDPAALGKLSKTLKHSRPRVFVINTPCLDVCPKNGVTVCTRAQIARREFSVLRTSEDTEMLLSSLG